VTVIFVPSNVHFYDSAG